MNDTVVKSSPTNSSPEGQRSDRERDHPPARKFPIGAEPRPSGGVHFRVAAPKHRAVDLVLEAGASAPDRVSLAADADGYFAGTAPSAAPGTRYRFRLGDSGGLLLPDPASRYQPEGPGGPSEVVDPAPFRWTD
jgi:maltooligosyltrehalose trehalohydrolase